MKLRSFLLLLNGVFADLLEVDNYGFPRLLENERVLVTFHAPWCSKCAKFLPELRKAEKVLSRETPPMKLALVGTCSKQTLYVNHFLILCLTLRTTHRLYD